MLNLQDMISSALVGGGLATTAVIFLVRSWLPTRIAESIKAEYAATLERLRAEISQQQAAQAVATGVFAAAHGAAHSRRLDAVEALWKTIRSLNRSTPHILSFADLLTREELPKAFKTKIIQNAIVGFDSDASIKKILELTVDAEELRPLLGEPLFILFFCYRAFVCRAIMLFGRDAKNGVLLPWVDDAAMKGLLGQIVGKTQTDTLLAGISGTYQDAVAAIEGRILEGMNEVISGKESARIGLERALDIRHLINEALRNTEAT